jgi:phenylacetate-CoA ligase
MEKQRMQSLFYKVGLTLNTYCKSYGFVKRQSRPDKIEAVQNIKLRKLIKYSYDNIKYYHELFDNLSINPDDIKTVSELANIPLLTKSDLRNRFWDFLPRELPQCRVSRTSGSTGIPVCILSDINSRLNNSAAVIRYRKALGIDLFGRSILTLLKTENEPRKLPHWTFLQGIHKTFYINPYTYYDSEIEYAIDILNKLKKPAIIGITPAIRALAYRIRDNIFPAVRPSAVLTTGEYLGDQVRKLLEDTFEVKVTDIYACNEAGDIAWQCHRGKLYHINVDNCIVEIIKGEKPAREGEIGEVVITNLNRFSMPIIRYKNGDLARFSRESCQCGCRLPVISEIIGRTGEDVHLPDGGLIPWNQLKSFMNHPQIRQFQIVQNADASITVKFVAEEDADIEQIQKLLGHRFSSILTKSLEINYMPVEKILPSISGKSKLVISNYNQAVTQS